MTALSSSRPWPAVDACMNIWCAVDASGSEFAVTGRVQHQPQILTKMSTADSGA